MLFVGDIAVGVIALLIGIGFAVAAVGDFLLVVRVRNSELHHISILSDWCYANILQVSRLYRSTGASLTKARDEFTSGVMRNEHVRGAAADVVGSAVRSQLNNPSGSGPRF